MHKLLIALFIFIVTIGDAFSQSNDIKEFYQPQFEKISVKPMCPASVPGQASCMAYGSILKVQTILGCLDELVFFNTQIEKENGVVNVYIMSLASYDKDNAVVRCFAPNKVIKDIMIDDMGFKAVKIHHMNLMNL